MNQAAHSAWLFSIFCDSYITVLSIREAIKPGTEWNRTLGNQIDTNKSLVIIFHIFGMSKPPKAYAFINFPHTFFNGTNCGHDLKSQYLLTRERYPRLPVRSEMCME